MKKLKCKRCGHSWIPRQDSVRMCPKCKSYFWNEEIKKKSKKKNAD